MLRQQPEEGAASGAGNVDRLARDQPGYDLRAPARFALEILGVGLARRSYSQKKGGEDDANQRLPVSEARKAIVLAFSGKRPTLSA